jgi:hypothetical protein
MFKEKVYTLSDQERQEAITYIDPMAKEMFGYYNQKDYDHFCLYCGIILKELMKKSPIDDKRELFGPYIRFDQPSKVIRKGGRYYVVYPVKFQKISNQMYLTFVTEGISSTPSLYGFAFSVNEEQYTSTGFDMEQDRSAISQ